MPVDDLAWEKDPIRGMSVEKVTQVVIYPEGWVEPTDPFTEDIVAGEKGNGVRDSRDDHTAEPPHEEAPGAQ